MEVILIYALIVASISFTITVTSIFLFFREWVSKLHPKLEELIHCPYCLGHYIAIALLLIVDNNLRVTDYYIINLILTVFAIIGIVAVLHHVMLRAYEPVIKMKMRREHDKLQKQDKID